MIHPRRVQHLEIDLIGVQKTKERPEAKEYSPLQPVDSAHARPARFRAISYLDSIFHLQSRLRGVKGFRVRLFSQRQPCAANGYFLEPSTMLLAAPDGTTDLCAAALLVLLAGAARARLIAPYLLRDCRDGSA